MNVRDLHRIVVRVSVSPIPFPQGSVLVERLAASLRTRVPVSAAFESAVWNPAESQAIVTIELRDVALGADVTRDRYVEAVYEPALAVVRRALEGVGVDAERVDLRVLRSWLRVDAAQIERIPRRPAARGDVAIGWYRVVLEVAKLGSPTLAANAARIEAILRQRMDIRSSRAFSIPERQAVGMTWEMEGFDREEAANAALLLAEDVVHLAVDGADDIAMTVDVTPVTLPH